MASRGFIELLRLADLARARKTGRHETAQALWAGIVFECAGQRFTAPLGEISEVLAMPDYTQMPLTKSWLLGVANARGRLLPLVDLAQFIGRAPAPRHAKVLVIEQAELLVGLVVAQVQGILHFAPQDYHGVRASKDTPLAPYQHGKFLKDGDYPVFMPSLLLQDPAFLDASGKSDGDI